MHVCGHSKCNLLLAQACPSVIQHLSSAMYNYFNTFQNLECMCVRLRGIHGKLCSNLFASPDQATPLHLASQNGHVDTVQHLIGLKADLNIKDDNGVSDCSSDCGLLHQR